MEWLSEYFKELLNTNVKAQDYVEETGTERVVNPGSTPAFLEEVIEAVTHLKIGKVLGHDGVGPIRSKNWRETYEINTRNVVIRKALEK